MFPILVHLSIPQFGGRETISLSLSLSLSLSKETSRLPKVEVNAGDYKQVLDNAKVLFIATIQ